MKRATVIFMTSVLAFGVLTGCGSSPMKNTVSDISSSNSSVSEQGGEVSVAETGETVKVTSVEGITFERPKDWEVVWEDDTSYKVRLPMGSILVLSLPGDLFDEADVNELARKLGYTVESTELVVINGIDSRKTVYALPNGEKMEEYRLCKNRRQISIRYTYSKEEGTTYEKEFIDLVKSVQFVDTVSEQSKDIVVESSTVTEQSKEVSTTETGKTVKVTSVDGITFERPKSWTYEYDSDDNTYQLTYMSLSQKSLCTMSIKCLTIENLDASDLLDFADMLVEGSDYFKSVKSDEAVTVNGKYARRIVYEHTSGFAEQYLIMSGDSLVSVLYLHNTADATHEKEFTDLVNSIQFVETVSEQSKEESSRTESSRTESPSMTMGQSNALKQANSYLKHSSFSYDDLIEQLEFEGYSHSDAVFAVDNCGADWYEQAVKQANSYLKHSSFSRDRLIHQLEFNGFTSEQAEYAAKQVGY